MRCPKCDGIPQRRSSSLYFKGRSYPILTCASCSTLVNIGRDGQPAGELVSLKLYNRRRQMFSCIQKVVSFYDLTWSQVRNQMQLDLIEEIPAMLRLSNATWDQTNAIIGWYEDKHKTQCHDHKAHSTKREI